MFVFSSIFQRLLFPLISREEETNLDYITAKPNDHFILMIIVFYINYLSKLFAIEMKGAG